MKDIFKTYTHSIPIIYSSLENQYPYDMIDVPKHTRILCTIFDFNFIAGPIPDKDRLLLSIKEYIIKKIKKSLYYLLLVITITHFYL